MSNKINKVGDSFVCPFCLHPSKLENIQFRSVNPRLEKMPDEKLTRYWRQLTGDKELNCVQNLAITSRTHGRGVVNVKNKAFRNVPVGYADENDELSQNRLCPLCHNPLPPNIGFVNTANIVVAGSDAATAFAFTKKMFEVLYAACTVEYVSFFAPQQQVVQALASRNMNALTLEKEKLLVGKLVYSVGEKMLCEITVTWLPLGLKELGNYSSTLLNNFFANTNGLILVEDYRDLECFRPRGVDSTRAMEYLLHISEYIGYSGTAEDAYPAAIVLANKEFIYNNQNKMQPSQHDFGRYEADVDQAYTSRILSVLDNDLLLTLQSKLRNNCFFSVGNLAGPTLQEFENPMKWLVKSYNLKEQDKKEKTPQAGVPAGNA